MVPFPSQRRSDAADQVSPDATAGRVRRPGRLWLLWHRYVRPAVAADPRLAASGDGRGHVAVPILNWDGSPGYRF